MTTLQILSEDCRNIAGRLGEYVLRVEGPGRIGSAFLWTEAGLAVSSAALLETDSCGNHADTVLIRNEAGEEAEARILMVDPSIDLAVLELKGQAAAWKPAPVPRAGDLLLSLGRPGKSVRVAMGMASAVSPEPWRTPGGGSLAFYVEVDGSLPEGFWGGPLVDSGGSVVGMNTGAMPRGIGMTVPVQTIAASLDDFRRGAKLRGFFLGVNTIPVPAPRGGVAERRSALMITEMEPGSPADEAGLLPGDVLFGIGDLPLQDYGDLVAALAGKSVSERLERQVTVWRGGILSEKTVTLRPRS
ncbi:MAG: hypothetical protein A2Z99_02165 [Treponema sp. GWB1_62_6]|nr:MAG: hypothetical protein A2001_03520 [Treponema sp. GWC1_61_84]OHE69680.1 MAG: hypothetical protein A2Z99_02165 [Treponema sp. GWB1_62_6]HCM28901.1 hypothetical protein [Treponema sp.]